jgi:hypothetical protein
MRPNATHFLNCETLVGWQLALTRQLRDGGAAAPPETLTLVDAAEDLAAAARSKLLGRGMRAKADRESLRDDLKRSIDAVGPNLLAAHATSLHDLRATFANLPSDLSRPIGATVALGHAEALLAYLRLPGSAQAAWHDVVEAFENDAPAAVCETRIAQLRAVLRLRGHDWDERAGVLMDVLVDRAYVIAGLRGEEVSEPDPRELAGSSWDERIALCADVVAEEPREKDVIVWFAFCNASLRGRPYLRVGRLEFFDGELWDDDRVLIDGDSSWPRPAELDFPYRGPYLDRRPAEHFVLLRVDLERAAISTARARARRVAETVPALVSSSSNWRLMEGDASYTEKGGWSGSPMFEDPMERALRLSEHPAYDPTGIQLRDLDEPLVDGLLVGASAPTALAEAYRWRVAVLQLPDENQRVALTVQAVERNFIAADDGDERTAWHSLLRDYARTQWAWGELDREIWDAAYCGVYALPDKMSAPPRPLFDRFHTAMIEETPERAIRVHKSPAVSLAKGLADELDAGSMERRQTAHLANCAADPSAAEAWLASFEERFDVLLSRAIRVRNAITHGSITVPSVVTSVVPFVTALESLVLGARHWAFVEDTEPAAKHQQWRIRALDLRQRLEAGEDLASLAAKWSGQ